ncbi:serine/threonine-protein phosphatase 4 regulatory subunit 2-like [Tigriopus californicus]|uniref:serine/threonine-protein phosphatase 4 regulatory subunit 2-like n=1 Tax=Tigriopus californicus TaxID=6832 RepID=UPI0027D9DE7D|nr:serine/threonine-protein phosphatase 4 regulatory subunit 2-like [Tigriopus californicus]
MLTSRSFQPGFNIMDNLEEVLLELNQFEKKSPETLTPVMEAYLLSVAQTGHTHFPWQKIKPLLKLKLDAVIKDFHASHPTDDLPHVPNVDPFSFRDCRDKVFGQLDGFPGIPFTVQRLCELLTQPKKHYKRTDKFMRAIEKNMLVVSTVDPRHKPPVEEDEPSVNTIVNGDHSTSSDGESSSPLRSNGIGSPGYRRLNHDKDSVTETPKGPLFPSLPDNSDKAEGDEPAPTSTPPPTAEETDQGESSPAESSLENRLASTTQASPEISSAPAPKSEDSSPSSTLSLANSSEVSSSSSPSVLPPSTSAVVETAERTEAQIDAKKSSEKNENEEDKAQPMEQDTAEETSEDIKASDDIAMVTGSTHDLSSDTSIDDVTNHLTHLDGDPLSKGEGDQASSEPAVVEKMDQEPPSSSVEVPDQTMAEQNAQGCASSSGSTSETIETNTNVVVEQADTKDQVLPSVEKEMKEPVVVAAAQEQATTSDSKPVPGVEEETLDEDGPSEAKIPKKEDSPTTIAAATIAVTSSTVISSS